MIKYITIVILVITSSCTSKSASKPVAETNKEAAKPTPVMEKTFPFSEADKVEIISFAEFNSEDIVDYDIKDGKLDIDEKRIIDKIVLNYEQKNELFKVLTTNSCPELYTVADCYRPIHRINFYKENKVVAFLEVCLRCTGYKISDGFKTAPLCDVKMDELEQYFREIGIRYFIEI